MPGTAPSRRIPLTIAPALSPLDFLRPGASNWKTFFPFSAPNGCWTFSGRVALKAGLDCLNLKGGDTILVPSYFQGTEIDTLLARGYKPRFYRLDHTLQADIEDIERRYQPGRVVALYIIHYFGFPQRLAPLLEFCRRKGIALIEDCALSLFSRDENDWLGSRGDMALFSVFKTLPIPHGGYLVTKNAGEKEPLVAPPLRSTAFQTMDLLVQHLRASRLSGLEARLCAVTRRARRLAGWRREEAIGAGSTVFDPRSLKYRASLIAPFLMRLFDPAAVIKRRRENYRCLAGLLAEESLFPELPAGVCPLFYPLAVDDKEGFRRQLAARGIPSVNLWIDPHPACPPEYSRQARVWREHIVELPVHQELGVEAMDVIGKVVLELLAKPTALKAA